MNTCYRCDKSSVTSKYPAKSTIDITEKAQKFLKISIKNAIRKPIQTCNACTSPKSRSELHKKNVFKRYEYQLLNLIVGYINHPDRNNKYNFDLNAGNRDKTRYDLIVKKSGVVTNNVKSPIILIEIDEFKHFTKTQFVLDRKREEKFHKKYSKENTTYIIRIRLNEKSKNSCIDKKDGFCIVKNTALFNKNIKRVEKYVEDCFGKKAIRHAYINFSEDKEIIKFPSFSEIISNK